MLCTNQIPSDLWAGGGKKSLCELSVYRETNLSPQLCGEIASDSHEKFQFFCKLIINFYGWYVEFAEAN